MRRLHRGSESGHTHIKGLLALLLFVALIYCVVKVVPAYVNNYEFQDSLQTEARFALANRRTQEDIRQDVLKKAKELGLPLADKDVLVTLVGDTVSISTNYSVLIQLPGYHFELQFHPRADNHSI